MKMINSRKLNNILFVFFLSVVVLFYGFILNKLKETNIQVEVLQKESEGLKFTNMYLSQLAEISYTGVDPILKDTIMISKLVDGKIQDKFKISSVLSKDTCNLIVRYTEIGCNACADSVIATLKKKSTIMKKYKVIFLVDFSNFDSYIKWKKISEINYPIYWAAKGSLPFKLEQNNLSYLFTVDKLKKVSNYFLPNSKFPSIIDIYIDAICKN